MRKREEKMAAELVARGWSVTPPARYSDTPSTESTSGVDVDLVAVIRPAGVGAEGCRDSRVTVCGPPAAGSAPRANLDGAGPHARTAFIAAGVVVPNRADHPGQTRPFADLLAAQGFDVLGPWVVGRDVDGRRYARVPVREVRR